MAIIYISVYNFNVIAFLCTCSLVGPPNIAALGTGEKTTVLEKGGEGVVYNQEKNIFGT